MISALHRFFPLLIATALVISASLLAGCGRKGPLDLPPTAAAPAAVQGEASPTQGDKNDIPSATALGRGDLFQPPGSTEAPKAAKGDKKRIILDPILD